jgi:hypothetical protein
MQGASTSAFKSTRYGVATLTTLATLAKPTSVEVQVRMFRRASLVLGVEGAGLINSLWLARDATVVNLHPLGDKFSTYESHCGQSYYWHIAGALNLRVGPGSPGELEGLNIAYYAFLLKNFSFFRGGSAIDTTELAPFLRELKQRQEGLL